MTKKPSVRELYHPSMLSSAITRKEVKNKKQSVPVVKNTNLSAMSNANKLLPARLQPKKRDLVDETTFVLDEST